MQIAQIKSASLERYSKAWQVHFTCLKDDGVESAFSLVFYDPIPWKSARDIVQVSVPGCEERVGLPCPEQIKVSAFGDTK
jgi:hypothetical protein